MIHYRVVHFGVTALAKRQVVTIDVLFSHGGLYRDARQNHHRIFGVCLL